MRRSVAPVQLSESMSEDSLRYELYASTREPVQDVYVAIISLRELPDDVSQLSVLADDERYLVAI